MKTTIKKLKQAVDDYLLWMISGGYADATIKNYQQILNHFVDFIACQKIGWDQIFSSANLHCFDQSAYSGDLGRLNRRKSAACSGRSRPPKPEQSGHRSERSDAGFKCFSNF